MKKLYGLLGYPLGHSFSARYFKEKFEKENIQDTDYRNFPIENIELLPNLLQENPSLKGLNVTIPYKEQIVSYLDWMSPEASEIGAINCVKIENGKLKGYNADAEGFRLSLLGFIGDNRPNALVLGTGGASKAVKHVLKTLGIKFYEVSRTPREGRLSYRDLSLEIIENHKLVVNTTPLGTYPNIEEAPDIPYEFISPSHYLFDLVYNPETTRFMKKGEEQGAKTINGYGMLVGQAEKSWEIWNYKALD